MFLRALIGALQQWENCFAQRRTLLVAMRQAIGLLACMCRATIAQSIVFNGRDQLDWSAEYKLHSRAPWQIKDLFEPIVRETATYFEADFITVAVDDTRVKKTGRCIPGTQFHRDPLSPPFHPNFLWGLRMLNASALLPLHKNKQEPVAARAVPVRFTHLPVVKKPGRKASEAEKKRYRKLKKSRNLSTLALEQFKELRQAYDEVGAAEKKLLMVGDGAFCNRTIFGACLERTEVLSRVRKDAKLCFRAQGQGNRFYGLEKFTPQEVRQDPSVKWKQNVFFLGGKWRTVRYKEVEGVLWQGGAKRRKLRLIVLAPMPYRKRKRAKLYYKAPAYLLTTELHSAVHALIQAYIDRWQIEVNHRELKTTLGVGKAQVWSARSVGRQPAFTVAAYSFLLLTALKCFGNLRKNNYYQLPAWRSKAQRPSLQDMINLLRKEITENPQLMQSLGAFTDAKASMSKAVA